MRNANADADRFANSDSYTHTYSNSYWNAQCYANRYSNSYRNTQCNTDRYRKPYCYQANTNTKTCSNGGCAAYSTSSLDPCAVSDVATTYSSAAPIGQRLKF